jgi:hypothetical protein
LVLPACIGLAPAAGCARDPGEKLLPVAGKVTVHGQPLAGGSVSFRPDGSRGNATLHHPTGVIDARGNFELYTTRRRGAPPGWYKVLVFADENRLAGGTHPLMPRWAVHAKYTSEQTTDLQIEVVDKPAPGAYDLELTR